MSTLNGVQLLLDDATGTAQAFLDRYLTLKEAQIFCPPIAPSSVLCNGRSVQKTPLGLPRPNYPPAPRPRINTLYWPTGAARWAVGWLLLMADNLADATGGGSPDSPIDLVLEDGLGGKVTAKVYALAPRPISSVSESDQSEGCHRLYLVPVVDSRYFWQFLHCGDLGVTKDTSWSLLFSTLANGMGITIAADAVDTAFLQPDPEEFNRPSQPVAVLLDAAAHSVGHRIIAYPDGSFRSQSLFSAEIGLPDAWALVAGEQTDQPNPPESIGLAARRYTQHRPFGDGSVHRYDPDPLAINRTIFTTAYANYDDTSSEGPTDPDNDAKLVALANVIRIYNQYATDVGLYDYCFAGVAPWKMGPLDDHVLWSVGCWQDGRLQAQTRAQSMPYNFGVDVMLQQDPDLKVVGTYQIGKVFDDNIGPNLSGQVSIYGGTPGSETDTTLKVNAWDFMGAGLPGGLSVELLWNEDDNAWYAIDPGGRARIVSVYDESGAPAGTQVSAFSGCIWGGKIAELPTGPQNFCEDPWTLGTGVWITAIDNPGGSGTAGVKLVVGDRYIGVYLESYSVGSTKRPLYAIRKGSAAVPDLPGQCVARRLPVRCARRSYAENETARRGVLPGLPRLCRRGLSERKLAHRLG